MNKPGPFLGGALFWAARDAAPVMAGYFAVSFVFGLTAVNQGFPLCLPVSMSIFVYAGASQFAALALLSAGAPLVSIVMTSFLINARHMLMSVYMSRALDVVGLSRLERYVYAAGLTDESFALHSAKLQSSGLVTPRYLISFNALCHGSWIIGTTLGALSSRVAANLVDHKLEFILTAMMIYVLTALCNTKVKLAATLATAVSMAALNAASPSASNIFLATLCGCGVGICLKKNT